MQIKSRLNTSWIASLTLILFLIFSVMPPSGYAAVTCSDLGAADGFTCTDREDGIDVTTLRDVNLNLANFNTAENSLNRLDLSLGNLSVNVTGGVETLIGGRFEIKNGIMRVFNAAGVHVLSTADFHFENASMMAVAGTMNKLTGKIDATGFVLNEGKFHGTGDVALLGKAVENRGIIDLPAGHVYLGAGKVLTVGLSGDNLVSVVVDEEVGVGDEVLDFEGNKIKNQVENSGDIKAHKITLDAKGVDSVFEKAINLKGEIKAVDVGLNDKGELVMLSMDDIYNNAILEASKVMIDSQGTLTNRGAIKVDEFREHAYTFKIGGLMNVGHAYFNNIDGAANILEGATLSGVFSDTGDIVVLGNFSLGADTTIWADDDSDGDGAINWSHTYAVNGNGHNLTLKASQNSSIGDISNVGVLDLQATQPWFDPTFVALPTYSTWSNITDFRLTNARLNRFSGGGVIGDPYLVQDIYGLQAMSGFTSDLFELANDIDASVTSGWNGGEGFASIGMNIAFGGNLDGKNYTIDNLYINRTATQGVGLFANLSGATIQNLNLTNVDISGGENTGGLVGNSALSTIQNVTVSGNVESFDNLNAGKVGGLAGKSEQDTISHCSFTGTVAGFDNVGGLIGDARGGNPNISWINGTQISDSWAIAAVTGRDQVGGFIGDLQEETSISHSFANGTVIGNDRVGGFSGRVRDSAVISGSYTSSDVIGANSVGGFSGTMEDTFGGGYSPNIYDSYATGNVSGFSDVGGFVGTSSTLSGQIINAYYIGQISSSTNRGGFVGANSGNSKFQTVYWFDKSASPASADIGLQDGVTSNYDDNAVTKISSLSATQQQASFAFDFFGTWAIDDESQTPYLQALGRHPLTNTGTPAPDSNSSFVADVLSKANFDRAIIQRDIFNNIPAVTPQINANQGDVDFKLPSHDFINSELTNPAEFLRQIFEGMEGGSNFSSNVIKAGDRFNFEVGADSLNLPEAMAIEDLFKLVFDNAEVQPAEKKPTLNPTKTVVANISGDVRVVSSDGKVYQAKEGMTLAEGDRVLTSSGASANLQVDGEKSVVSLKEKTVVGVANNKEATTEQPQSLLMVALGKVTAANLGDGEKSSYEIRGPQGMSGMRG